VQGALPPRDLFKEISLAIQIFSIPARGCQESAEEFNQFLRSRRIVAIERQLILDNGNAYWSLCVEYLERGTNKSPANLPTSQRSSKAKVDYREVLNAEDFAAFVKFVTFVRNLLRRKLCPFMRYSPMNSSPQSYLPKLVIRATCQKFRGSAMADLRNTETELSNV
jgi:hypothetical protein